MGEQSLESPRVVHVPTLYGGEYGPDLEYVAGNAGIVRGRGYRSPLRNGLPGLYDGIQPGVSLPRRLVPTAHHTQAGVSENRDSRGFRGNSREPDRGVSGGESGRVAVDRAHSAQAVRPERGASRPAGRRGLHSISFLSTASSAISIFSGWSRAATMKSLPSWLSEYAYSGDTGAGPSDDGAGQGPGTDFSGSASQFRARWTRSRCAPRICWRATTTEPPVSK